MSERKKVRTVVSMSAKGWKEFNGLIFVKLSVKLGCKIGGRHQFIFYEKECLSPFFLLRLALRLCIFA